MYSALLAGLISTQLVTPVSDRVPKLDVATTCKGSVEADKAMGLALPQSFDKCMSDENTALQQLGPIWSSYSASVQASCEGEAVAGGNPSYVDLLTCLQMNDTARTTPVTTLRGASRKKAPN